MRPVRRTPARQAGCYRRALPCYDNEMGTRKSSTSGVLHAVRGLLMRKLEDKLWWFHLHTLLWQPGSRREDRRT